MAKLATLSQCADALNTLGYRITADDDAVLVQVGGMKAPFTAVLTVNAERNDLDIVCRVAKLGDVPEENLPALLAGCLEANQAVKPYAFATISALDARSTSDGEEWILILTDSLPFGDLSVEELAASMRSLLRALMASRDMLRAFLSAQVSA